MLVIHAYRLFGRLPWLARVGALLMVAGALIAIALALGSSPHHGHAGQEPNAHAGISWRSSEWR